MENLSTWVEGSVLHLKLNRPESRNALNRPLVSEMRAALAGAATQRGIRSIVITGEGPAFSAGADLDELRQLRVASIDENRASSSELSGLFRDMRLHPRPIIARVNGHAIAGGCGLAIACDIAIASDQSKLGFSEVRIGFVPAIISTMIRTRVSEAHLRELLLTGRLISAVEAVNLGLVSSAVPEADLDAAVHRVTSSISEKTSPTAVAWTKRMLASSESMPPDAAARFLAAFNVLARSTDDVHKGVSAFLEKRAPDW
jgi:methylglutaconyl-CoA hydratase